MEHSSILPATWDVPALFRKRLGDKVGRQRTMEADGHLLVVAHRPPQPDDAKRAGRFFWRNPAGEWHSSDLGQGPQVLTRHLEHFASAIDKLERREDAARSSKDYYQILEELAPLARATRNLHAALQDAREATGHDRIIINARDRAYELERQAELLLHETKNSLDVLVARKSEELAESGHRMAVSAHRLNILAAFFFPIVTLATIFGANLQHGFEGKYTPWPFVAMALLGLFLGLVFNAFVNIDRGRSKSDHQSGATGLTSRPPRGD